ncbi:hypothetical protein CKA32_005390 [Geitlerinema sp. FC II]|nr:hypothetical protein CKA32_005390 [Geitlerinema sp. FC II]
MKVSQSLLEGNAAHVIEKLQLLFLFPLRQHRRGLSVSNPFLSFVPSLGSGSQGFVVNQTNATERPMQEVFLFGGRVKTVSERSEYHASHINILTVNPPVEARRSSPIRLSPEIGVSRRDFR